MSEVNANSILDGLTLTLREQYPNSHIFVDEVTQGLTKGDFIVVLVDSSKQQNSTGWQYRMSELFDILYFPKVGKPEAYTVGDELLGLLEFLTLPGNYTLKAQDLSYKFVDGVLHVNAVYRHNIRVLNEQTTMEQLKLNQQG